MLMYKCEHCGQFTFLGYTNEIDEFFCSTKCYELYCVEHSYTPSFEKLHKVDGSKEK